MTSDEVLAIFAESGALLEGHFLLSSGLHSPKYLQCALVLQHPSLAERLSSELAHKLVESARGRIDVVVAPALGGVIVGHEVARALGVRALFTERQDGAMSLRRGFSIEPGERCLVVEDVITTGGSTREVMSVVVSLGAEVAAVGSLIDRSGGSVDLGVARRALAVLEVPTWSQPECPLCAAGSVAVKPGSRPGSAK
jgi:orotate phosphoribosyltransferase